MFRTLAICPKEYVGVTAVLKHGQELGLWEFMTLPDAKETLLSVSEKGPDLLIFGAWHQEYEIFREHFKCAVYITSTLGQMELSPNIIELMQLVMFDELLKRNELVGLLAGWPSVASFFRNEKAIFCPYPFNYQWFEEISRTKEPRSVGFFSPTHQRKNMTNQLVAASLANADIHTNIQLLLPNVKQTTYPWLKEDVYFELIRKMKTTLHCGFTESFCYAAAESIMLGTLPIVSFQVALNLGLNPLELNVVDEIDSTNAIQNCIETILDMPEKIYKEILDQCKVQLILRAKRNLVECRSAVDKLVSSQVNLQKEASHG